MRTIMVAKVEGNVYRVVGTYPEKKTDISNYDELDFAFHPKISMVMENGHQKKSFGQTWVGTPVSPKLVFGNLFSSFVNNDCQVEFMEVCQEIKDWKEKFQSYPLTVGNRKIPKIIVTENGELAELCAINRNGFAYYADENETVCVLLNEEGNVVATVDAFLLSSLIDDYKDDNLVFMNGICRQFLNKIVEKAS